MASLPTELILMIFNNLSDAEKWNLATTCTHLMNIFQNWAKVDIVPIYFANNIPYRHETKPTMLGKFSSISFRKKRILRVYEHKVPLKKEMIPHIADIQIQGLSTMILPTTAGGNELWARIYLQTKENLEKQHILIQVTFYKER